MLDNYLKKNFFYINDNLKMNFCLQELEASNQMAIDTEFSRSNTYFPVLSIIQIAIKKDNNEKKIFIIDCLQDIDLSSFWALIASNKIIKIIHSSLQDLQIFFLKSQLKPENIFDTQLMANFCGFGANIGYASLVQQNFQLYLDKKLQRSDWCKRPLSEKQLQYACLDVVFLHEIFDILLNKLIQNNRLEFYFEEIKNFVAKALNQGNDHLIRNFSLRKKNQNYVVILKKLLLWREDQARIFNIPRQHFLKDEELEDLASSKEINIQTLTKLNDSCLIELKEILNEEISDEAFDFKDENGGIILNNSQKIIFVEAKKIITKIALGENIAEQFLLNNSDLKKIITQRQDFANNPFKYLSEWRCNLLYQPLIKILNETHHS